MNTSAETQLREKHEEALELERKAQQATVLEREIADLRRDLGRFLDRQNRFAALGDEHLQVEQKSPHAGLGVIEWAPLLSKHTGREMAEQQQGNIDSIQGEIAQREMAIAELLSA